MPTSYPGAVDAFTNPSSTDDLDTPGVLHDEQHANANDAIEAIETELGPAPSGSYATVKARLDAVQSRVFDAVAYGALVDGSTDDTAAWQAAIDAAATAGGGVVLSSKPGVSVIGGALQDTGGANSQLTLPQVDYGDGEAISITIAGPFPNAFVPSVIGATPLPDNGLVLKSTLASGSGAVIGGIGPSGTTANFTNIHLAMRDVVVRTVSNPTISGIDVRHVATFTADNLSVDSGSFDVDALTQPTTATSFGLRLPENNNGAAVMLGSVQVVGFYTGIQWGEHAVGVNVAVHGCRVAVQFDSSNHASTFLRLLVQHCTVGLKFTGAHAVDVWQFDVEHANSSHGWRQTTYDVDDASNYGLGFVRWWAVLAGTGPHSTFTVNGATGITTSRVGSAIGSGGGTTTYWKRDRVVAAAGNTVLTLGATPVANSPIVWVQNVIKWPGTDYTISGDTITFNSGLAGSDVVLVTYETTNSSPGTAVLSTPGVNIQDNFTRANSTSSLGSTSTGSKVWTQSGGTWGINSNQAYVSAGHSGQTCLAYVDAAVTSGTVSATVTNSGSVRQCGFILRADGAGNHYVVEVSVGGSGTPTIYKGTAGAYASIATGSSTNVASGSVLSATISGNTITVKDDGVTIVSVTDSTWASHTRHGLYMVAAAAESPTVRFDDFSILP